MLKDLAYHALADLIYRGALFAQVDILGHTFIFKTVNPLEFGQIRLRTGSTDMPDYNSRYNIAYLAYSVFMVDNENVLVDRDRKIIVLIDFFKTIPSFLYKHVLKELDELRVTVMEVSPFVEGFCYTQQSREKWELLGNNRVNDESFSGFPGMSSMGLNGFQESWMQINSFLDDEEKYNQYLSLALLISSSSNPKGSKKVRAQHDASLQAAKEKRKQIAKEGFTRKTNWSAEGWALPVDTAEELVAELERQMSGLKDRHDLLVDDYLKGLQDESDKIVSDEKQKMEESVKRHENEPRVTGSHRALTPEEAKEMLSSRGHNNLMIVDSDEVATVEEKDRFYKKVGSKILTPKNNG